MSTGKENSEAAIKTFYEDKYSSFKNLPAYRIQANYVLACMRGIEKSLAVSFFKSGHYVDLGCGIGTKTYACAATFSSAVGIDLADRAIRISTLLNDNPALKFEIRSTSEESEPKADVATAFGLSMFNLAEVKRHAEKIAMHFEYHVKPGGLMIIGSLTDFSSKSPSGWHMISRSDLRLLVRTLAQAGYTCRYYFPHRHPGFFFGNGLEHFFKEVIKLISRRRRDFFMIIEKKM